MEKKNIVGPLLVVALIAAASILFWDFSPVASTQTAVPVIFDVNPGDGFRTIAQNLFSQGLIRSPLAFEVLAVFDDAAFHLHPGIYRLSPAMSPLAIARIVAHNAHEVTVTIPEGFTMYQIDRTLSNDLILSPGDLIAANVAATSTTPSGTLEGRLFPDTYDFFTDSNASSVIQKFLTNFNAKAGPLLAADPKNAERNLIIASLLQEEVSSSTDEAIVAGILEKRLAAGMPLDIDATICYIKQQEAPTSTAGCYPLSAADYKIDSPYNTYLYKGLPPAPIGNPGVEAITAAMHPVSSTYWYYLSDPKTGATIYAATLAQQEANQRKYLEQN